MAAGFSSTERSSLQFPNPVAVRIRLSSVATQLASALTDKAEENARVIADAVRKAMNKVVRDAADAIIAGEDRQAKVQDIVKQKMEQRNAVMQQAEK